MLGTPIPKGLHVRHNFATGVTEAKLMDDTEEMKEETKENVDESMNRSNSKSMTLHPDKAVQENEETDLVNAKKDSEDDEETRDKKEEIIKFHIKELKEKLKRFKQDKIDISNMNVINSFINVCVCVYYLINK